MRKLITALLTAILLIVSSVGATGALEDANKAYASGDYAKAAKLNKLYALKGDAQAQYNLGIMYANGQGVVKNDVEAVKWYKLAAAQGFAQAQSNLGIMCAKGEGVVQDYVVAHMWSNLAAAQGNAKAIEFRALIEKLITPQQIAEAQKLARECLARKYKGC